MKKVFFLVLILVGCDSSEINVTKLKSIKEKPNVKYFESFDLYKFRGLREIENNEIGMPYLEVYSDSSGNITKLYVMKPDRTKYDSLEFKRDNKNRIYNLREFVDYDNWDGRKIYIYTYFLIDSIVTITFVRTPGTDSLTLGRFSVNKQDSTNNIYEINRSNNEFNIEIPDIDYEKILEIFKKSNDKFSVSEAIVLKFGRGVKLIVRKFEHGKVWRESASCYDIDIKDEFWMGYLWYSEMVECDSLLKK